MQNLSKTKTFHHRGEKIMIATLTGKIKLTGPDHLILDVKGVGYEVFASAFTLQSVKALEQVELFIYTHVKEDTLRLYGFFELAEKTMFLSLLQMNGVGPKMALAILSAAPSLQDLVSMIEHSDIKGLSRLPRVGKKTAQQMILTLKGKLSTESEDQELTKARQDLRAALSGLGFKSVEIQSVLDNIKISQNREKDLKKALSYLQPEFLP